MQPLMGNPPGEADPVVALIAERAAQGFGPTVDDPAVLRRVAALVVDATAAIERRPA